MILDSSIVAMGISAVVGIVVPVSLWILYRRNWKSVLTGVGVFFVMVLILEASVNVMVLTGGFGTVIKNNVVYMALYGGLMAGIFEECGRFIGMKYILKGNGSAVAYGVGHGGIEFLVVLALGMISNIALATAVNSGQMGTITSGLNGEAAEKIKTAVAELQNTGAEVFMLAIWERFSALILQVALSVIVWFGVKKNWWLLLVAIALHALVDGCAVMMKDHANIIVMEVIICAMSLAIAAMAFLIWKKFR